MVDRVRNRDIQLVTASLQRQRPMLTTTRLLTSLFCTSQVTSGSWLRCACTCACCAAFSSSWPACTSWRARPLRGAFSFMELSIRKERTAFLYRSSSIQTKPANSKCQFLSLAALGNKTKGWRKPSIGGQEQSMYRTHLSQIHHLPAASRHKH